MSFGEYFKENKGQGIDSEDRQLFKKRLSEKFSLR